VSGQTGRLANLIGELYRIHAAGGPLHVQLDDGNLDGVIEPWYSGYAAEELDALWLEGWPLAELPPECEAVTSGLGRSTRQLCDEIAQILNATPEAERRGAVT
jgi:hypothetical protein